MNSITSSDNIATLSGVNLAFRLRHYANGSLRQLFVDAVSDPVRLLLKPRRMLHVLNDINLQIRSGDRLGILGVNGSGKTTLCRCIAGMYRPNTGSIQVNGVCRAIFNTTAGIVPELTGRENAELLVRLLYPNEIGAGVQQVVEEAIAFSELGAFLDAPYETYSQGMKSRLCLAVLTARSGDLLILDEAYDNADQFFQAKMMARMQQVIHASKALIFVSHSRELILQHCNRAIVLHQNRIVFDGAVPKALLAYELFNSP